MKTLNPLIFLPFLAIGLLGKVSAEARLSYSYSNSYSNSYSYSLSFAEAGNQLFSLRSKNIRKPKLDFWQYYWNNVKCPIWQLLFGSSKLPKTNITHCHPFTEELTNLLMEEFQFSWMKIISDVEIIDGNPWWCKLKVSQI